MVLFSKAKTQKKRYEICKPCSSSENIRILEIIRLFSAILIYRNSSKKVATKFNYTWFQHNPKNF